MPTFYFLSNLYPGAFTLIFSCTHWTAPAEIKSLSPPDPWHTGTSLLPNRCKYKSVSVIHLIPPFFF